MADEERAREFAREIARVLSGSASAPGRAELDELRLARRLAALDLSAESRVRTTLKARLLRRAGQPRGWVVPWRRTTAPLARKVWALAAGLAAALLMLHAATPGFSASLRAFLFRWLLGDRTEMVGLTRGGGARAAAPPRTWLVQTSIGNFSGAIPSGSATEIRLLETLEETRKAVPGLYAPAWLPPGFRFQSAVLTPPGGALLLYGNRIMEEIVLYQTPAYVRHVAVGGMREARVSGRPAAWVEGGQGLAWEKDGISFSLGGRRLRSEDAVRIAESLAQEGL